MGADDVGRQIRHNLKMAQERENGKVKCGTETTDETVNNKVTETFINIGHFVFQSFHVFG